MVLHARTLTPDGAAGRVLGLSAARLLQDWRAAHGRALAYLEALGVPEDEHEDLIVAAVERALTRDAWGVGSDAIAETLRALREVLVDRWPVAGPSLGPSVEDAFVAWRLGGLAHPTPAPSSEPDEAARCEDAAFRQAPAAAGVPPLEDGALRSTPPITRGAMTPELIERGFLRRLFGRGRSSVSERADDSASSLRRARQGLAWVRASRHRRLLLGLLVLLPSVVASGFMVNVLPGKGDSWLEAAIVLLFGALFGWISIGFWTALLGFFVLVGRRDRFAISAAGGEDDPREAARGISPEARTAIVMPICEEPVGRVFAGLRAIHRSLERIGAVEHFHFFVLSDSADPSTAAREEEAWASWCREVGGFGRIFYRRRKVRLARKSGNVADFCRRHGRQYRYMIMLDADSIMTGDSLVRLVRMMEARPDAGLIQTAPSAVNRHSLLARVQQFCSRLYGPLFAAGLHFWQLGDAQYWGHNAIVRIAPFMRHCALPRLPGKPPFGGEILSHDFVESALLARSGWTVWLAYDVAGSFEEVPSTLLEEMGRDRRWCQGNLQHLRLLFSQGIFGAHRALFVNGVLSYVSALLWFAFLLLSTAEAIKQSLIEPDYFPNGPSLFPEWPVWRPDWAMALLAVTAVILFLPKVLAITLVAFGERGARPYGGVGRLSAGVVLEVLLSSLLAPIRMVFHSRFVLTNLFGRTVTWGSQGRQDAETRWGVALRQHGGDTLFASAWGALLFWLNPDYFWWVLPIIGALLLSIPLSVLTSRVAAGRRARRIGLFRTPEEKEEPIELRDVHEAEMAAARASAALHPAEAADGLVRAIVDPLVNALHRALIGPPRTVRSSVRAHRAALVDRALSAGVRTLDARERKLLFRDPDAVDDLHRRAWALASEEQAARWGRPGEAER
jgi:membrane glycosyltransferase